MGEQAVSSHPQLGSSMGCCLLCQEGAGPGPQSGLCTSRPLSLHRISRSQPQTRCHLKDKRTATEQWGHQQDAPLRGANGPLLGDADHLSMGCTDSQGYALSPMVTGVQPKT